MKSIAGGRISLTMKDVDQETGEDLNPTRNPVEGSPTEFEREAARNPDRPVGPRAFVS